MEGKDYFSDKLRKREKTEEDRYFAKQDRALIEQLHGKNQNSQQADQHEGTEGAETDADSD